MVATVILPPFTPPPWVPPLVGPPLLPPPPFALPPPPLPFLPPPPPLPFGLPPNPIDVIIQDFQNNGPPTLPPGGLPVPVITGNGTPGTLTGVVPIDAFNQLVQRIQKDEALLAQLYAVVMRGQQGQYAMPPMPFAGGAGCAVPATSFGGGIDPTLLVIGTMLVSNLLSGAGGLVLDTTTLLLGGLLLMMTQGGGFGGMDTTTMMMLFLGFILLMNGGLLAAA